MIHELKVQPHRLRALTKTSAFAAIALLGAAMLGAVQAPPPRDWIDTATGHRVVRLTDDAGGSTLYFHDNAFSPEGDKLMFTTPRGMAVVDVAKIGQSDLVPELVTATRGGYFARRSREIYYSAAAPGAARGGGAIMAVNVDTKKTREVKFARGLVNADETLSLVKNGNAIDTDGKYPKPPVRQVVPQLQRMFPGKRMD